MNSMWILFSLLFAACLELGNGTKFLLAVPKQPHFDSDFTATISAVGVKQKEKVTLEYRGVRDRSRLINSTTLTFTTNLVQTWTVLFPWSLMKEYGEDSVALSMSSLYNQQRLTLTFSHDTGYIFIQTDKPLYSPGQKVKFRIMAVDEYQRLTKYPLKVDVLNEQSIVVDRMRYISEDAFQGQEFELPRETPPGNWTISANFEGLRSAPSTKHTVNFEVREYVLPRFSASLETSTDVITMDTRWLTITITAKYVYGRMVTGLAEMQLGIWDPKMGVQLLPVKYSAQLKRGIFKNDLLVSAVIPKDIIRHGKNKRLYISVNVTENGSQEVDRLEDTSTYIAHPFYDISYDMSKKHVKPGFPYTLETKVNAKSGRAASRMYIWADAQFVNEDGRLIRRETNYLRLDGEGKSTKTFDVPKNTHNVTFKTVVIDFKAGFNNDNNITILKMPSNNNQYLHISVVKSVTKHQSGLLTLRYTPLEIARGFRWRLPNDVITILVISKGHLVHSANVVRNTDGLSSLLLPSTLYAEISPFMRVVAFYHFNSTKPEYVSDSIKIVTDDACVEELSLRKEGNIFMNVVPKKPKEEFKLRVDGGPNMKVGLVAVDKAVFLLNDRHTLTRDLMFEQLATHDLGTGIGDGQNVGNVLKGSGLAYMVLDTEEKEVFDAGTFQHLVNGKKSFLIDPVIEGGQGPHGIMRKSGDATVPNFRKGQIDESTHTPPQTVRRYFPESWLFENHVLPSNGILKLKTFLPDSITTWSLMAVGISSTRGICVSQRLEQEVLKLFFVDVRVPYKVTRLEVVNVKIAIYNYHSYDVLAKISVTGDDGICFSANQKRGSETNGTDFSVKLGSKQSKSYTIKVIPLRNGDLTLRADVSNQNERDVVLKKLYVVAEGLRVRKSLTFVLDPEAKHATYKARRRNRVTMVNTGMINNMIDTRKKTQKTKIDLAMPREVIRGTEFCRVSAFGDLMGDIINHAVIKSKSLMENGVQDAEEVIGDLGPTVHALLYANLSGLMNEELKAKGQRFVRHSVLRLLKYRNGSAFNLLPGAEKSTWLTIIVLKTLCHATPLAYIDKTSLIDEGFRWLLSQTTDNGTLNEKDWRLAEDSEDYKIMLSAEVLIALLECDRSADEGALELQGQVVVYLEDIYPKIVKPMVLAKVAYALVLFDRYGDTTRNVIKMLNSIRRRNRFGQYYWGDRVETNEKKSMPFWYRKGAKASSIEATAYALLVYLHSRDRNVDAVADWLVAQRNDHGSFVGAMDSIAAIQALVFYSLEKHFVKVDLSCNVSFDKQNEFSHSFKFTEKNAIRPELLSNVPVGQTIEVLTKGQGLGQMQVNVEYNIPYDQNENCPFNVTIEVKNTQIKFFPEMFDYPLCMSCDINCPKPEPEPALELNETNVNCTLLNGTSIENFTMCLNDSMENSTEINSTTIATTTEPLKAVDGTNKDLLISPVKSLPSSESTRRAEQKLTDASDLQLRRQRIQPNARDRLTRKYPARRLSYSKSRSRKPRSIPNHPSASKRSICIHVCVQHLKKGSAGETRIEIEMLTGYFPVMEDIKAMANSHMVKSAAYREERGVIVAVFKKISDEEKTCIAFRAVDMEEVGRPLPAAVVLTESEEQEPSCVLTYHPPKGQQSLQVYCADFSHINRGECRCYSGICSACSPNQPNQVQLHHASRMVCRAAVGYQVQLNEIQDHDQWLEINAKVLSLNKTGSHKLKPNEHITLITPSSCYCPAFYHRSKDSIYMLTNDVERMVDRRGKEVHRYLLDENSAFLRVAKPEERVTRKPSVPHWYLKQAFSSRNRC